MAFKMSEKSLFATLLRSSWWISLLIAVGMVGAARWLLSDKLWAYGAAGALPFVVISVMAAWKQRHKLSGHALAQGQQRLASLSWADFSKELEAALKREGYAVTRLNGDPGADMIAERAGRMRLISARRWKASSAGVEAMQQLRQSLDKREAQQALYLCLGQVSEPAQKLARAQRIAVIQGPALVQWLSRPQ